MDPLSISTAIITILQATTAVISVCYDCRAQLNDEPWSLTRIIDELKVLRNILERLEDLAQDFQRGQGTRNRRIFELLSDSENGPLANCRQQMMILDNKIRDLNSVGTERSKGKALLRVLRWQLKDKDAKKCLEIIERCKNTLSLALDGDQTLVKLFTRYLLHPFEFY